MNIGKADHRAWSRREFVHAGLVTAGAMGILPALVADDPVSDLDDLARMVRGRMLRGNSPGYDEARKVWNLAYDRRPLAMVRAANVDDVRGCVEFAGKHSVPIAIRDLPSKLFSDCSQRLDKFDLHQRSQHPLEAGIAFLQPVVGANHQEVHRSSVKYLRYDFLFLRIVSMTKRAQASEEELRT